MEQNSGRGNGLCCEINAKILNRQQHNKRVFISKHWAVTAGKCVPLLLQDILPSFSVIINCLLLRCPLVLFSDATLPNEYT